MDGSGATGMSIHTLGWFSASSVIRKLKEHIAGANIFRDRQLSVLLTMKRSEKKAAFRLQRS